MVTRRIAVTACALCLAVPGIAGAQPIHDSSGGHADQLIHRASPAKETPGDAYSQLSRAKALDNTGGQHGHRDKTSDNGHVDRVGSLTAEQLLAAYGATKPAAGTHASIVSSDDTNGWRIAAVAEAALLAALALISARIVRARRRVPRMGM